METPVHVPLGQDGGETGRPSALARPEVSIAIVSYNTRDYLKRCIATVAESRPDRAFEIIVVDNCSSDGSPEMVSSDFPNVHLLANGENVGYSRAVNQAIQTASGRYVLILNPDIEVMPGAIDELASHLDRSPETGIAGGKLLNPDGTLQYSCRTFYTFSTLLHRRTPIGKLFPNSRVVRDHLMLDWAHDTERQVDWMLGACMMVRVEAIREVGLMDERFFMYFEDVDWCYRMKQHGWKVMYVPDARMTHAHQRESARRGGFNPRLLAHLNSMFRFFDKWNTILYRARKHRDVVLGAMHLGGDLVAVNLAFLAAWFVRSVLVGWLERPVFPLGAYEPFVFLTNSVVLCVNAILGLYRRTSARDLFDDAFDLAKGLAFSTLVLMASTFLTGSKLHSRLMVAVFVPAAFVGMLAGRVALGSVANALRRSRFDLLRIVVIGEREAASELAAGLSARPEIGYDVVATLPDRPGEGERRFREFWDAEGIRDVIHRHRVGEMLVVRPTLSDRELARLVLLCRRDGVLLRLVSGVADFLPGQLEVSEILGRPAVDLSALSSRRVGRWRRLVDILVSGVALVALGPAGWRRAFRKPDETEPGEEIRGLRGSVFRRAHVRPGARNRYPETLGHVLRGDLSLVGPRPVSSDAVERCEELRVLFDLVRPGATGTWRLHQGEMLTAEQELSLALSYIQNQSPLEDLKIVLRTVAPPKNPVESRRSDS